MNNSPLSSVNIAPADIGWMLSICLRMKVLNLMLHSHSIPTIQQGKDLMHEVCWQLVSCTKLNPINACRGFIDFHLIFPHYLVRYTWIPCWTGFDCGQISIETAAYSWHRASQNSFMPLSKQNIRLFSYKSVEMGRSYTTFYRLIAERPWGWKIFGPRKFRGPKKNNAFLESTLSAPYHLGRCISRGLGI